MMDTSVSRSRILYDFKVLKTIKVGDLFLDDESISVIDASRAQIGGELYHDGHICMEITNMRRKTRRSRIRRSIICS